MIDNPYEPEILDKLAQSVEGMANIPGAELMQKICKMGFKGDKSLDFYDGLFSAYMNAYGLLKQMYNMKMNSQEEMEASFGMLIAFLATELKKMKDAEKENPQTQRPATTATTTSLTPEQALEEYEKTWELTTEERTHMMGILQKVATPSAQKQQKPLDKVTIAL